VFPPSPFVRILKRLQSAPTLATPPLAAILDDAPRRRSGSNRFVLDKSLGLALFVLTFSVGLSAQAPPDQPREWRAFNTWLLACGPAYPEAFSGGVTAILGKYRTGCIPGRGGTVRGVEAGVDVGAGGMSAKIGFANLFRYDAGYDGYSFDLVYVRPWLVDWGLQRGGNLVGAGITRHTGWYRLSGAVLTNVNPNAGGLGASVKLGCCCRSIERAPRPALDRPFHDAFQALARHASVHATLVNHALVGVRHRAEDWIHSRNRRVSPRGRGLARL
jgi:hypothetical protein